MSADLRIETPPGYPEQAWVIAASGHDLVRTSLGCCVSLHSNTGRWYMQIHHASGYARIDLLPEQMRILATALNLTAAHAEAGEKAATEGEAA